MSIMSILLAVILLPGLWQIYKSVSGFFARHTALRLGSKAQFLGFVTVVIIGGLIASPLMMLGLPGFFRLLVPALYILVLVLGAKVVWTPIQKLTSRSK
jgi:hypothetical protein